MIFEAEALALPFVNITKYTSDPCDHSYFLLFGTDVGDGLYMSFQTTSSHVVISSRLATGITMGYW